MDARRQEHRLCFAACDVGVAPFDVAAHAPLRDLLAQQGRKRSGGIAVEPREHFGPVEADAAATTNMQRSAAPWVRTASITRFTVDDFWPIAT